MNNPAEQLLGLPLEGGWRVVERVKRPEGSTGGNFSIGYIVENDSGIKGFLKALDYSSAKGEGEGTDIKILQYMLEAFNFERDLLEKCRGYKMSRVVVAINSGKVIVDPNRLEGTVEYIIFEKGDGDVRTYLDLSEKLDTVWVLRVIHHIAVGLDQLHRAGIAHQDLKPSNALIYNNNVSKVSDLGSASDKERTFPVHDGLEIAGERNYAPPELLYHHNEPDWNIRRFGCDTYLLGSLILFLFTRVNMTAAIQEELSEPHRVGNWSDPFQDVLPYLRNAYNSVISTFSPYVIEEVRDKLVNIVRELCEPDPKLRGRKRFLSTSVQYSLESYISEFDLLTGKAEIALFRKKTK